MHTHHYTKKESPLLKRDLPKKQTKQDTNKPKQLKANQQKPKN